ncbi:TadE/TadG family type IV pilus assembly protein [Acidocella aminolytica]|uniref:TadE-like domain-containing protein n=1 Tax=Acidocella aminolytica 101 = DSM 11237 TaxID=1120923 RepID=A0A0D6PGB2_9PROT|nr:TadE/TadG family type IV pilus assembly protein [Acidocella aminolytica]GAN80810.1 hypothetical protein Aam_060_036 [Acidocella aminolytica 101 = DSM 11237]GBQ36378.1 hypothetical protein AA11237_1226 [Acidocella aminolytica 101 = DSM 11237]SHE32881.1 TadE-like protein [Acidocella aminolytica 101 = DSM 11237]
MNLCVWRILSRFTQDKEAATAVEFAIIGSVFFLIIAAIFILSLDMYWQLTLDTALNAAVREVQIGKVTTGTGFVDAVCQEFTLVAGNGCTSKLQYSVQSGSYFGSASDSSSIIGQAGGLTASGLSKPANFPTITRSSAGAPQFVLIQVAFPVPFSMDSALNAVVTQNGTDYLYSAAATEVEP